MITNFVHSFVTIFPDPIRPFRTICSPLNPFLVRFEAEL
jgi:hypothetical protein